MKSCAACTRPARFRFKGSRRRYCKLHYDRLWRTGKLERSAMDNRGKVCPCGETEIHSLGLCQRCYQKKWRRENPEKERAKNRRYRLKKGKGVRSDKRSPVQPKVERDSFQPMTAEARQMWAEVMKGRRAA